MMAHLARVADLEGAKLAQDAFALITRAAEGSVRDAMSLMDQAIAHGAGETSGDQVRAMLGLADRGRTLDLFDLIMKGDAATALCRNFPPNMPTGPIRWPSCAIWPRSRTGFR
jgi:DNA polymerase-3 subunit gamma/tau